MRLPSGTSSEELAERQGVPYGNYTIDYRREGFEISPKEDCLFHKKLNCPVQGGGQLYVESQTGPSINSLDKIVSEDKIKRFVDQFQKAKRMSDVEMCDLLCGMDKEPEEEYDCPIHGKLGGIDECPRC